MMRMFYDIFDVLQAPVLELADKPLYSAMPVPGYESYFVGKDRNSFACLLISTGSLTGKLHPSIRLRNLDVQFDVPCNLVKDSAIARVDCFTVIRCRTLENDTIRYFLSVCETVPRMLGEQPSRREVARAVNQLAAIFHSMQRPPARSVNGLFGEVFLIFSSRNANKAVATWRMDDVARFDFLYGDIRVDVKVTAGRTRIHNFSYEQCNPPEATVAMVASICVEQVAAGVTLRSLISDIESRIAAHPDLVFKLHETVAKTLGSSVIEALAINFDIRLAESSLQFFDLEDVPAIRGPLPIGVSEVHFRSDLSGMVAIPLEVLIDRDPLFADLLPSSRRN